MRIGPKYKIARHLGDPSLFSKTSSPKFALRQSRKKSKITPRRRGGNDYALRLIERQKTRFAYGLSERKLAQLVKEAKESSGRDPVGLLHQGLERRLDNVVYRLGFAPSRLAARQLVSHGHICVNGRRLNIPSYQVRPGDEIGIGQGSLHKKVFEGLAEKTKDIRLADWLSFDSKNNVGRIKNLPTAPESEAGLNLGLVIDLYSRV